MLEALAERLSKSGDRRERFLGIEIRGAMNDVRLFDLGAQLESELAAELDAERHRRVESKPSSVWVKLVDVSPTTSGFYRLAIGGVALALFLLVSGKRLTLSKRAWRILTASAVLFALDIWFWHRSIEYVGPYGRVGIPSKGSRGRNGRSAHARLCRH